jgi:hypothetical protein
MNTDLKQKNKKLNYLNNELDLLNKKLAEMLEEEQIKIELLSTISEYTAALNNCEVEKVLSFYADTVSRYFLVENVDKDFIRKDLERFFINNKDLRVLFNLNQITLNIEGNQIIARIDKEYYRKEGEKKSIITEMRFNEDNKIVYIRDYYTIQNDD